MRIKQLYSNFGIGFSSAIKKKYQFEDYTDSREPVFMFGCYGERQIHMALSISKFSPLVVICWGGSDAKILKDLELSSVPGRNFWSGALRGTPNIKHIAISHWIEEDMQILKLPYYSSPMTPHNNSDIKLTQRESEIIKYSFEGLSNKEIADKMFITEATVKYHIKNIYEILELKNRKEFFAKKIKI